jgi:hypothetical protein
MQAAAKEEDEEKFNEQAAEFAAESKDWETYKAAVEASSGGTRRAIKSGSTIVAQKDKAGNITGYNKREYDWVDGQGYLWKNPNAGKAGQADYLTKE